MAAHITKETIQHLAKLSRVRLDKAEEKELAGDLSKILAHFEELQTLDTSMIAPVTGGTRLKNVFREDISASANAGAAADAFPESEDGFLLVPPVFEP